jgi:hypothetical protein
LRLQSLVLMCTAAQSAGRTFFTILNHIWAKLQRF